MRDFCTGHCPRIHRAGYVVVLLVAVAAFIISLLFHSVPMALLLTTLTGAVAYFFRDPERVIIQDERLVISPADGVVTFVKHGMSPPEELGMSDSEVTQVSICLNIMDVHVNRMPVSGKVTNLHYSVGKFKNMYFGGGKDTDTTTGYEKQLILVEDARGNEFAVAQIAGAVARRIVCSVKQGEEVKRGQRLGIICFGSRVDLYMPSSSSGLKVQVRPGQTVVGGETVLAVYDGAAYDGSAEVEIV